jgi:trimeric autotransporter adhesin
MNTTRQTLLCALALLGMASAIPSAHAAPGTWVGNTDGSFTNGSNWASGSAPVNNVDNLIFNAPGSGGTTVNFTANYQSSSTGQATNTPIVLFSTNSGSYTFTGSMLTFGGAAAGGYMVDLRANDQTITFSNSTRMNGSAPLAKISGNNANIAFGGTNFNVNNTTPATNRNLRIVFDGGTNSSVSFNSSIVNTNPLPLGTASLTISRSNSGSGTVYLNAASNPGIDNALTIGTGTTLSLGNGGANGSLAPVVSITNNGTLQFNRSTTISQGTDFNNTVSGTGGIIQSGSGTTVLSGSNSYSGTTRVTAGVLEVSSANGLGNSTTATIQGGTLALSGSGSMGSVTNIQNNGTLDVTARTGGNLTIGPTQTVSGSGTFRGNFTLEGSLAPGNSPGLQTYDGNLTLGLGSTILMEITGTARGTEYDAIDVTGTLGYGGALTLNFANAFSEGDTFNLFDFNNQVEMFSSINLTGSYTGAMTNNLGVWTYSTGGTHVLMDQSTGVVSVVPEPSTYALIALAGAAFLLVRRPWRKATLCPDKTC